MPLAIVIIGSICAILLIAGGTDTWYASSVSARNDRRRDAFNDLRRSVELGNDTGTVVFVSKHVPLTRDQSFRLDTARERYAQVTAAVAAYRQAMSVGTTLSDGEILKMVKRLRKTFVFICSPASVDRPVLERNATITYEEIDAQLRLLLGRERARLLELAPHDQRAFIELRRQIKYARRHEIGGRELRAYPVAWNELLCRHYEIPRLGQFQDNIVARLENMPFDIVAYNAVVAIEQDDIVCMKAILALSSEHHPIRHALGDCTLHALRRACVKWTSSTQPSSEVSLSK